MNAFRRALPLRKFSFLLLGSSYILLYTVEGQWHIIQEPGTVSIELWITKIERNVQYTSLEEGVCNRGYKNNLKSRT